MPRVSRRRLAHLNEGITCRVTIQTGRRTQYRANLEPQSSDVFQLEHEVFNGAVPAPDFIDSTVRTLGPALNSIMHPKLNNTSGKGLSMAFLPCSVYHQYVYSKLGPSSFG